MKECTKPNCNCIELAEAKAGGPVKNYPCLADHDFNELKSCVDMQYCNYCQTNTRQVAETTGMRCQKCSNQNPFFNSSAKEYAEYLHDLCLRNGLRSWEDLNNYYDEKKRKTSELFDIIEKRGSV